MDTDLVVVLETNDQFQFALATSLLQEADIPYNVQGNIATLITDIDPFLQKRRKLQVSRDREAEAREILATL